MLLASDRRILQPRHLGHVRAHSGYNPLVVAEHTALEGRDEVRRRTRAQNLAGQHVRLPKERYNPVR